MARAAGHYARLYDAGLVHEAAYALPLATRIRALFTWNLREVTHFVELRSARQGHPSYRKIAQDVYHAVAAAHPLDRALHAPESEHSMPSHENKPGQAAPATAADAGELSKKVPDPIRFELPDNALIARRPPPRPRGPPPVLPSRHGPWGRGAGDEAPRPRPLIIAGPRVVPPPVPRQKPRPRLALGGCWACSSWSPWC